MLIILLIVGDERLGRNGEKKTIIEAHVMKAIIFSAKIIAMLKT